jgi:hypothetical protein
MDPKPMDRKEYLRSLALLTVPVALAACGVPQVTVPVKVRVVFSEPMDHASVESAAELTVAGASRAPTSITWEDDTTVLFNFGAMSPSAEFGFNMEGTARDLAGNTLEAFEETYA